MKASAAVRRERSGDQCPPTARQVRPGPWRKGQRWTAWASEADDVVLRLLRGESLAALTREVGVEIYRLEDWRDRAVAGLERGLQKRQGDLVADARRGEAAHRGAVDGERAAA